jgi:hypothetical protein
VVDKNGKVVPTGQAAPGSAAAKSQAQINQAIADRQARREIADAANKTRIRAAQISGVSTAKAAQIRAASAKAVAQIKAEAANDPNKPPSAAAKTAIFDNVQNEGATAVEKRMKVIMSKIPGLASQGKTEPADVYKKRHDRAVQILNGRYVEHRADIVDSVANLIAPQLKLIGYGPDQINGYAASIVNAYIPAHPSRNWTPPGIRGPV